MTCKTCFRAIICFLILAALTSSLPLNSRAQAEEVPFNHETGFYYTIQRGDTLWDLSGQFFDSPWVWPDLWNKNRQIANPHWIYPGERIRLYQGEGTDRLSLLPPPEAADTSMADAPRKAPYYYYAAMDGVGFVRKAPIPASGTIFKVEQEKEMIYAGDVVYIHPAQGQALVPGSRYTIYRTMPASMISRPTPDAGIQHYLTGIVEITRQENDYAIARVVRSFREAKIGDQVMPYHKRSSKISLVPSPAGIDGKLMLSEEHAELIGTDILAFFDKGSEHGIKVGQQYNVFYQDQKKLSNDSDQTVTLNPVVYGTLLVLHTEATTATVLVTDANTEFHPGDRVCSPLR